MFEITIQRRIRVQCMVTHLSSRLGNLPTIAGCPGGEASGHPGSGPGARAGCRGAAAVTRC